MMMMMMMTRLQRNAEWECALAWLGWWGSQDGPQPNTRRDPPKRGTTLTAAVDVIWTSYSFQTAIVTTTETKDNEKKKKEEEEKEKGTDNEKKKEEKEKGTDN